MNDELEKMLSGFPYDATSRTSSVCEECWKTSRWDRRHSCEEDDPGFPWHMVGHTISRRICNGCGDLIEDGKFCLECQEELRRAAAAKRAKNACLSCGTERADHEPVCIECGTPHLPAR